MKTEIKTNEMTLIYDSHRRNKKAWKRKQIGYSNRKQDNTKQKTWIKSSSDVEPGKGPRRNKRVMVKTVVLDQWLRLRTAAAG